MNALIRVIGILLVLVIASGCKKKEQFVFDVNEVESQLPNAEKRSLKSEEQYVAVLYANLFQKALSADQVIEIKNLIDSVGDKETVHEVIVSSFMNDPDVLLPTRAEALADMDGFIQETYKRFLVRNPTEAEKEWFKNFITTDEKITPELVYLSFAIADEYLYY